MPDEHPTSKSPAITTSSSLSVERTRLTLEHRLRLAQEISKLVKARLPLEPALGSLSGQATGGFSQAIETVCQRLQAGHSLAASLAQGSDSAAHMLAASIELGEHSGKLDQALDRWAEYYLTRQRYARRLSSATLYPLLLVMVALICILFSVWRLLPQYREAFAQLAETQPAWLNLLDLVHQNFGWFCTVTISLTVLLLWRSLGNRLGVDRWSIPRSDALRSLFYSRIAHMSSLGVQSGRPIGDWIELVIQSVGLQFDKQAGSLVADDVWGRRLGNETCGVLVGLDAGHLSVAESSSLLRTIADNFATHADLEVERQVHRLPMLTSIVVGSVTVVTYLGLIYLPWLALYYHIAKNT